MPKHATMVSIPTPPRPSRWRAAASVLAVALLAAVNPLGTSLAAAEEPAPAPTPSPAPAYDSVIDITFPTAPPPKTSVGDWYDAARSGGRAHKASDIMGPKLTPIYASRAGKVVRMDTGTSLSGNYVTIAGDDGRSYSYLHLNNDTPGTDDGAAPPQQVFAPGIEVGATVVRGQHIAWMGDSGNAETTGSHVHFSITDPAVKDPYGTNQRDPYPSLRAALTRGDLSTSTVHPLGTAPPPPATGPVPDLAPLCGGTLSAQSFTDVATGNVHAGPIGCLAAKDVALGFTDGRYGPGGTVTRLQMASFVARLLEAGGVPLPAPKTDHFDDDAGTTHERAVNQLVDLGIIRMDTGEVGRSFEGGIAMKRDRMAAWMARAYELIAGEPLATTATDFFRDDSQYHHADVNRLAAAGIVQGVRPGSYEPRTSVRRDQMASYLARTLAAATLR